MDSADNMPPFESILLLFCFNVFMGSLHIFKERTMEKIFDNIDIIIDKINPAYLIVIVSLYVVLKVVKITHDK